MDYVILEGCHYLPYSEMKTGSRIMSVVTGVKIFLQWKRQCVTECDGSVFTVNLEVINIANGRGQSVFKEATGSLASAEFP
jgi:hypothetical protein